MKVDKTKWKKCTLEKVCTKGSSNIVISKIIIKDKGYPLYGASGLIGYIDVYHNDKIYLGLVKDGSGVGRVAKYPAYSSLVGTMQYIYPNSISDIDYLKYLIRHLNLAKYVKGAAIPHIYFRHYKDEQISIPPLSEQRGIAAELDAIQAMIDGYREQLADLDRLAQSIFLDTFGDPISNPKGWGIKNFSDIASLKIGLTYKPSDVVDEGGTIVLRSSNIKGANFDLTDIVRVNVPLKENLYVEEGDLLMCARNGSFRLVGKCALIPKLSEPMTFGAFMTIIRSKYNTYLFHLFQTHAFRIWIRTAGTATINQVTHKMLNAINLPFPPLSLQQQFAEQVEAIERQKEAIRQQLADAETLMAERMQYYFS